MWHSLCSVLQGFLFSRIQIFQISGLEQEKSEILEDAETLDKNCIIIKEQVRERLL